MRYLAHSGRRMFVRSVAIVRKVLDHIYFLRSFLDGFKAKKKFETYQVLGKSHIKIAIITQIVRHEATTTFGHCRII